MSRVAAALVAAAAATAALAGCSSAPGHAGPTHASAAPVIGAPRWWTASDYCGILRQTVHAGRAILPNATAGDPQVLAAARSFTATLTAAAPPAIRPQWHTLSAAVLTLVRSAGKPRPAGAGDLRGLSRAAAVIAADARTRCSLTLGS